MRVLFSTDWHLGYEMGVANRVDRLPDQVRQLERIGGYVQEHDVDVLAVAGDVFEAQERGRARAAVHSMMRALGPALERGLQVVMIAGNHDRDYFIETANEWLSVQMSPGGDGTFVMTTRPRVLTLEAKGERVNFVLLPFPTPVRYAMEDMDDSGGAGARNNRIGRKFIETMESLRQEVAADRLPTVLLAHTTVEGTEVGPHRLSPRDDIVVPRSAFPSFEMTVVGHIHKAEKLAGEHFYYVGVLDRMDYGERDYETRVLLADIGPKGVRDVTSLPLDPTPFVEVFVEDEDGLQRARDFMERPDETLVKLRIRARYGTYTAPLIAAARNLFPRLYGNVEHEWVGAPVVEPSVSGLDAADVRGTIEHYLQEQVADEQEREELLELVDELRVAAGGSWT
jgi:exonuclease SbcD